MKHGFGFRDFHGIYPGSRPEWWVDVHSYDIIYIHYIYIFIHIYIHIYIYISVYTSRMSFMVFTNPKNNLGFSGEKHSTIGMVGNLDDWTPPNPFENVTHLLNPGIC